MANADDPLVAWAVADVDPDAVVWVGAGLAWELDSSACPWCEADLAFGASGWRCAGCGRTRPEPQYRLADGDVVDADGAAHALGLALPGRSARANATMAYAALDQLDQLDGLGRTTDQAISGWSGLASIEGRYQHVTHRGVELVLHLAKNPAGWADLLDLVAGGAGPLVLVLNAQGQDGRDPSWIWDVPFEQLAGRRAYCLGERGLDLAVRLDCAGLDVAQVPDLDAATDRLAADAATEAPAGSPRRPPAPVDLIANYSAFQQVRRQLAEADPRRR